MRRYALALGILVLSSSTIFAAKGSSKSDKTAQQGDQMQMQQPNAGCRNMSYEEQDFANQIMNANNRAVFCSQFSPKQRQQAMQMMGQMDAQNNQMNADDAVQQVMQMNGMQRKSRSPGGCPVK